MMITIQPAISHDAPQIALVQERVWPSEQANMARITSVLQDPTHTTLVALAKQQVVGFVDCFETVSASGTRRWEIDLLAVDPHVQGQGIGKRLTAAATSAGEQRGITLARALVATHNIASQRTFARCGYQSNWIEHGLYICTGRNDLNPAPIPDEVQQPTSSYGLISVSTLRYRGLWIEERWSSEQFIAAQQLQQRHNLDVVGAVIPLNQPKSVQTALEAEFSLVGQFHWWRLRM